MAVQLDAQHDRSTVRVTNQGKDAVILQGDAIGWERDAGVDRDASTSDLIVKPPVFTVARGQTQIVRVGLRRNSASETESTYRMVLREVPSEAAGSETLQGQVRVLVAVSTTNVVFGAIVGMAVGGRRRSAASDRLTERSMPGPGPTASPRTSLRRSARTRRPPRGSSGRSGIDNAGGHRPSPGG